MRINSLLRQSAARFLMCDPSHFGVSYAINPWMDPTKPVDKTRAMAQWNNLKTTLESFGAKVDVMTGQAGVPDLVFTLDAGLVFASKVWLSSFYHKERQAELIHNEKWFKENGFETFKSKTHNFEAGDALFSANKLFAGFGFRTDAQVYEQINNEFFHGTPVEVLLCELVNPNFYHLDACFCPLNSELAIFYPGAFSESCIQMMKSKIELIPVPKDEAYRYASNMVVIGNDVVLHEGNDKTYLLLEKAGFNPHPINVDQFSKAGGFCRCLTLPLSVTHSIL